MLATKVAPTSIVVKGVSSGSIPNFEMSQKRNANQSEQFHSLSTFQIKKTKQKTNKLDLVFESNFIEEIDKYQLPNRQNFPKLPFWHAYISPHMCMHLLQEY